MNTLKYVEIPVQSPGQYSLAILLEFWTSWSIMAH